MNFRILNPLCTLPDGGKIELEKTAEGAFASEAVTAGLSAGLSLTPEIPEVHRLVCVWTNRTGDDLVCRPELRFATGFVPDHYVIPGISYNGNHWGRGLEPKGLDTDGEPWVFDDRRTTIPACTVSENETTYFAVMVSDGDDASHCASCSMARQEDGTMLHRVLWPETESPKTYCDRDRYSAPHGGWVTIPAHGTFTVTLFLLSGKPVLPRYGTANVENAALALLGGEPFVPRYTPEEVAALCCSFAKTLLRPMGKRTLFCIGYTPDGETGFRQAEGSEFGWCGQNGMYARLMLRRGAETGDGELTAIGCGVLDAFSHEAVGKTGLIRAHYGSVLSGGTAVEDTCNLGFAVREFAAAWAFMKERGEEHPAWITAARSVADFLLANWSDEHGFGKSWNVDTGECVNPDGTIGAYLIPGLTELYRVTGEPCYLDAARRACRFYRDRDLAAFRCTAGALDTWCIDKESSAPLIAGAMELYDIDETTEWLDCAKMAAWYFCSWMFHHDTVNLPGTDFETFGYRTIGGSTVSAQHHHIDLYGALIVPYLFRLGEASGDGRFTKRASLLWANAVQNIAPAEGCVIHGRYRRPGAQNEAYFHCHWQAKGDPGEFNEWLVAWPGAFCWNTAEYLRSRPCR